MVRSGVFLMGAGVTGAIAAAILAGAASQNTSNADDEERGGRRGGRMWRCLPMIR
jgi:hypothetical protein